MKPWITYSLVRVGIFAVVLTILLLLLPRESWWVAAIAAAIIGLCVSTIFFGDLRRRVAEDLASRRGTRPRDDDAEVEDR